MKRALSFFGDREELGGLAWSPVTLFPTTDSIGAEFEVRGKRALAVAH